MPQGEFIGEVLFEFLSLSFQYEGQCQFKQHFYNILLEVEAAELKATEAFSAGQGKGHSLREIIVKIVVLNLWLVSESPGGLVKTGC